MVGIRSENETIALKFGTRLCVMSCDHRCVYITMELEQDYEEAFLDFTEATMSIYNPFIQIAMVIPARIFLNLLNKFFSICFYYSDLFVAVRNLVAVMEDSTMMRRKGRSDQLQYLVEQGFKVKDMLMCSRRTIERKMQPV